MMAEARDTARCGSRPCRRIVAMLAILSMALYAALVPGHVVSSSGSATVAAAVSHDGNADCHKDKDLAGKTDPATPDNPKSPKKRCPFCSGYAAFQAAMAGELYAGLLDAEPKTPKVASLEDSFVAVEAERPHNRGPPLELSKT